jgi:hypothetical protein
MRAPGRAAPGRYSVVVSAAPSAGRVSVPSARARTATVPPNPIWLFSSRGKRDSCSGSESPEKIEKLWLAEAERRFQELLEGVVQGVPAREVFAQLRAKLSS